MIRFTKARGGAAHRLIIPFRKANTPGDEALRKLNVYLEQEEPETVHFLANDLAGLSNTVTYKELREAYLSGGMTPEDLEEWQIRYSEIVDRDLRAKWERVSRAAADEIHSRYSGFYYDPDISAAMAFIRAHGAELCTNLAQEQIDALNAMVAHISGYTAITPDEASLMMRGCIGLTKPQTTANLNYRRRVEETYMEAHPRANPETARKKAREASARYAARQHRYRAMMIARTELAFGYNAGHHGAMLDAQRQGFLGEVTKVWVTAYDERTCPSCSKLDGVARRIDETFPGGVDIPPKHPHCRCAVAYEEVETDVPAGITGETRADHEQSRRRDKELNQNVRVDWGKYADGALRRRVDSLGEDVKTSRGIFQAAKEILNHRDGTLYEDLGFVDSRNGKWEVNKDFDYYDPEKGVSMCKANRKMRKMREDAGENIIISLHNHPKSYVPSIADLRASMARKDKYGLVFAHDGKIFRYIVDRIDDDFTVRFSLDRLEKAIYNDDSREIDGAIRRLALQGVRIEVER